MPNNWKCRLSMSCQLDTQAHSIAPTFTWSQVDWSELQLNMPSSLFMRKSLTSGPRFSPHEVLRLQPEQWPWDCIYIFFSPHLWTMSNYTFSVLETFTADVENQHGWSGLTTGAACGCTPVSQHTFSVVHMVWLFCAVESSQLTYVTTILHAVWTDTREKTKFPLNTIWS